MGGTGVGVLMGMGMVMVMGVTGQMIVMNMHSSILLVNFFLYYIDKKIPCQNIYFAIISPGGACGNGQKCV